MTESGYTNCACRDCFEIAISDDVGSPEMCVQCEEAGCTGEGECSSPSAFGGFTCECQGERPYCLCQSSNDWGALEAINNDSA